MYAYICIYIYTHIHTKHTHTHRLYMKCWYDRWAILRLITLNYFLVGWIIDGCLLDALNTLASKYELERIEAAKVRREAYLMAEVDRIANLSDWKKVIAAFLEYPANDPRCVCMCVCVCIHVYLLFWEYL
jgi:hypothetical protein